MISEDNTPFFTIPEYHRYISPALARELLRSAHPCVGVNGLVEVNKEDPSESPEALEFLVALYEEIASDLQKVLHQRSVDRQFMDERVRACAEFNARLKYDISDADYKTIIGLEDANGRIVMGPQAENYCQPGGRPVAEIPDFLQGPHVTLFGPPDTVKMAINAMNAYHRRLKNEPLLIEELLKRHPILPKWGADDEDSKTPLRRDLIQAERNLTGCFEGNIQLVEGEKKYQLASSHLALPIKRFPGLALPSTFLFYRNNPIPLHLYDFALHLHRHWHNPQALVFYVPKLENEEEAAYIHKMIACAERLVHAEHPEYRLGSVRLMIVLENPRAILRLHEIMDTLHPYFVGASLGWHDYLASTARIFKEDPHYRIPVKADPNIVIKYIKASHHLLADVVGSRGGIKIGGMYGVLPQNNDLHSPSFQLTLLGFIKDVITQMKRDLNGFWVAHPDFVRLGLALVAAWQEHQQGQGEALVSLIESLLDREYRSEVFELIRAVDDRHAVDANYVRTLVVADIKESDYIANNHPDEIRYNVFQTLQYLTDWLSGNGCVALPALIRGVPVRIMDDLATAERSRWEVWHELHHGRFALAEFVRIAHEEMHFIRKDLSDAKKIVQVKWNAENARWYPIAFRLMLKLMTDPNPPEFVTELLMPFTVERIREAPDPWVAALSIDAEKYRLTRTVEKLDFYFSACGCLRFASTLAPNAFLDFTVAEHLICEMNLSEVLEAASFHGDIGEARQSLDQQAAREQQQIFDEAEAVRSELKKLGQEYRQKFGFKFLISAQGKRGTEILVELKRRLMRSPSEELDEARQALWEITAKRLREKPLENVQAQITRLLNEHDVVGASVSVNLNGHTQTLCFGDSVRGVKKVDEKTTFQIASLSKTLASAFCLEYFARHGIPLATSVNELLQKTKSTFRLENNQVQINHLMNHTALSMHYVKGLPAMQKMPRMEELLQSPEKYGYDPVRVLDEPGRHFSYSGGGFLVLQHLIESLEDQPLQELTKDFFQFDLTNLASGYLDTGQTVPEGHLQFPLFAAGSVGTTSAMAKFLSELSLAHQSLAGTPLIHHDTAVMMLCGADRGARNFIGADMGLGVFVVAAGDNKFAMHQGANEGFRALFLQCFSGPDAGTGLVIYANGDNQAVPFIAAVAQKILRVLNVQGIDYEKFATQFSYQNVNQEQIVNLGYKHLLFSAFMPCRPPVIINKGSRDPVAKYNLATHAKILAVSDERFARAENFLSEFTPSFDPELFCAQGKVMDSWESARHNENLFHILEFELEKPALLQYVSLSTRYHDGNHVEFVQLMGRKSTEEEWTELLPKIKVHGHSKIKIKLTNASAKFLQIQVRAFPDGGLTRLGLFSELPDADAREFKPLPEARWQRFSPEVPKTHKPLSLTYHPEACENQRSRESSGYKIDIASSAFGGRVLQVSNEHYGPAAQVISPFPPLHMFDGFESARSRNPGHHEELLLQLGELSQIQTIVFDFKFFVNNNPQALSVSGWCDGHWHELVLKTPVKAFAGNQKEFRVSSEMKFSKILVKVFPDGGINRIHVFGSTTDE